MKKVCLLGMLVLGASCGQSNADKFIQGLESSTGKDYSIIRLAGRNGHSSFTVIKNTTTGKTWAVNVDDYAASGMNAMDYFSTGGNNVVKITSVGSHVEYSTEERYFSNDQAYEAIIYHGWKLDTAHYNNSLLGGYTGNQSLYYRETPYEVTDYTGSNGMVFDTNLDSGKDLESLGANVESLGNEELIYNLEENYGLSEKRAASVAKITSSFKKIQNKRSLTDKEMNIYTQKVLGVDYSAGKKALEKHIQGDSADMEAMMERAADMNGTSPEAVTELVGEYLLN